nr:hypothetical protein [Zhaonella formicivorans]
MNKEQLEAVVRQVVLEHLTTQQREEKGEGKIPLGISNRHVHL